MFEEDGMELGSCAQPVMILMLLAGAVFVLALIGRSRTGAPGQCPLGILSARKPVVLIGHTRQGGAARQRADSCC